MNYTAYRFELNVKLEGWFFFGEHWCKFIFNHVLPGYKDQRTEFKQTVNFVQLSKILENIVVSQANRAQRAVLSNLKVRLEKK